MHYTRQQVQRIQQLESCFEQVHQKAMRGMPIVNPYLEVTAIGFRPWSTDNWDDALLGILLTPWFMNLLILPESPSLKLSATVGSRHDAAMPAGSIECLWSQHDDLGVYLSCSLMSPVLTFESQQQAQALAEETLSLLLTFPSDHQANQRNSTTKRGLISRIAQSYRKHADEVVE
jgi:[NiFe] hydrogenase assembly HybE family chaperone